MRVDNPTVNDTPPAGTPPVSIIVPVYNERERISDSLERIWAFFDQTEPGAEIIVVDDGSSDDTLAIARTFEGTHPGVRILAEKHRGKAAAVISGLEAARGKIVGFMDIDLATPLETWLPCRDAIANGAGVAIGSREGIGATRIGEPIYRHIMGRIFNGLVRLLLLPGIHDSQCGFKFFSRAALDDILPRQRLYRNAAELSSPRVTAFDVELLFIARQQGYEIVAIPVTWHYGDHSKVNPVTDALQNLKDILTVRLYGWRGKYT